MSTKILGLTPAVVVAHNSPLHLPDKRNCPLPWDAVAVGEKAQLRTVETCTYHFCSVNIEKPPPAIEYCHRCPLCACSSTHIPAEEELPCETLSSAWVITYLQLKRNCCAKPLSVSVPLLTSSRGGTVVRTPASACALLTFHRRGVAV
ncbi:unnamed protein product [Leuciscus chuanchicus]